MLVAALIGYAAGLSPTIGQSCVRGIRAAQPPRLRQLPALMVADNAVNPERKEQPDFKYPSTMPSGDALDKKIAALAFPAIASFLILPIASATDLFWVGRMGEALAIAGQVNPNLLRERENLCDESVG